MSNKTLKIAAIFGADTPHILSGRRDYDPEDIYFGPLLHGFEAEIGERAAIDHLSVAPSNYLKLAIDGGYDALLIMSTEFDELPTLTGLMDAGITFVAVGASPAADRANLPTVDCDNRAGGAAAAAHLLSLGHTRLGCINLAAEHMNHSDRFEGFEQAAAAAGHPLDLDCRLLNGGYRYDLFPDLVDEWIGRLTLRGKLPTAVFACDFRMAQTAMDILYARAIDVPFDISMVGFDDPPGAARQIPPMTTFRQPVYEMGATAARRLMEALQDPGGRKQVFGPVVLQTAIVVRGSTAKPREW